METVTLSSEDLYRMIKEIIKRLKAEHQIMENRWISSTEAMKRLGLRSKTSMQRLRDQGKIRFFQERKIILYDATSISEYLEKYANETF